VTSHPHDPRAWQRPDDPAARPASASLVDPEDDLPSTNYAGDFETTAIPPYDASKSPAGTSGLGLIGEPEPLPYVQPGTRQATPPFAGEPSAIERDDATDDQVRAARRRGTQDLGLMLLRVGLGALLIAHGLRKAFGWWGGQGLNGFEDSLADLGYQHAGILSYLATGTQIAAGALLVLGLFTPLAAAAALAYLVNALLAAAAAQGDFGGDSGYFDDFPFFLPEGHEFQITLIVVTVAIILIGPGRYGFDAGRGWARRPFVGSFAAVLLGIGAGIAVWAIFNGANPLS
jgi:putative oxidoreductase